MTAAGTTSSPVPRTPVASSTGVANRGPIAKPVLPPRANTLIARVLLPAACRAARAPSGWKAAIPSPKSAKASQVSR